VGSLESLVVRHTIEYWHMRLQQPLHKLHLPAQLQAWFPQGGLQMTPGHIPSQQAQQQHPCSSPPQRQAPHGATASCGSQHQQSSRLAQTGAGDPLQQGHHELEDLARHSIHDSKFCRVGCSQLNPPGPYHNHSLVHKHDAAQAEAQAALQAAKFPAAHHTTSRPGHHYWSQNAATGPLCSLHMTRTSDCRSCPTHEYAMQWSLLPTRYLYHHGTLGSMNAAARG
jgi:hypothetical protein